MIDIEDLRQYYKEDSVVVTRHAAERFRERGIRMSYIEEALNGGEIIEQYENDSPFPSCLVLGYADDKALHIVMSDEGSASRIITGYWPDMLNWKDDYRTRREGK